VSNEISLDDLTAGVYDCPMISLCRLLFRGSTPVVLCAALAACSSSDSSGTVPPADGDASMDSTPWDVAADAPAKETSSDAAVEETSVAQDVTPQDALSEPDGPACKLVKSYSSSNAKCNDCVEQKCCVEMNGCLGNLECDDTYVNCILACVLMPDDGGDAGMAICMDECAKLSPKGKAEYDVAIGCADDKCGVECQ
jgi:hypothetical protein